MLPEATKGPRLPPSQELRQEGGWRENDREPRQACTVPASGTPRGDRLSGSLHPVGDRGEVAEWAACPGAPGSRGLSTPTEEAQKPLVSLSLGRKEASHREAVHVDASPVPEEQARHPVRGKRDRCTEASSQPPGRTRDAPGGLALPREWPQDRGPLPATPPRPRKRSWEG